MSKAWETSWDRHRSRRWPGLALIACVVAASVIAGLAMEQVPHGAGFFAGLCAGCVLGGGLGLVAWVLLGSDGSHTWRLGLMGEQFTWPELKKLGRGWTVLHSLDLPAADGSTREIDHIAVGPAGTFVIDSKLRTDQESLDRISMNLDKCIRPAGRQAGVVRFHLGRDPRTAAATQAVISNLIVWGSEVDSAKSGIHVASGGTWVVHGRDLETWRRRVLESPPLLNADLASNVIEQLRPYCKASSWWIRFRTVAGRRPGAGPAVQTAGQQTNNGSQ